MTLHQRVSTMVSSLSREKNTNLFVSELNQARLILDNLVLLGLAILEQLRQSEPLPRHLVPVICIHELIVIDAIWCITPHFLDCRLATVKVEDIVDESLALL